MGRTPSHKNDHLDEEVTARDMQRSSRDRGRRQPVKEGYEEGSEDYKLDEHPEIPRIRRASRFLDLESTTPTHSPSKSARRARLAKPQPGGRVNTEQLMKRRLKLREEQALKDQTRVRRPRTYVRERPQDQIRTRRPKPRVYIEDVPAATPEQPTTKSRPVKAPTRTKQFPAAYHIPTVQQSYTRIGRRERRAQRLIFDVFHTIRHNRPLALILSGTLILLIVIPLLTNMLSRTPTSTTAQFPGSTGNQSSTATAVLKPANSANPHELVIVPPNNNHPAPPILATSAYLLDADTGVTLYARNPFMHIPMMSTTKLMTALLAIEHGNLDQQVTITPAINNDLQQLSADSSLMGIKPGETYSVRDLLYGLLLVSGNDAALAIADADAGTMPKFVDQMNQRAQQLGLHDTHFRNPHGLIEDNHYSSAHDLAILGQKVFSNAQIRQISSTKEYHIVANTQHAEHFLENGDQFMYWYPGVDGGKTGWDAGSNFLQVISCTRNNHHLIGVVMHTADWWTDMRDLMNYGFSNFTWISPREINANVHPIPFAAEWTYFHSDTRERTIPMGNNGRFYVYTEYAISGLIMNYFDKNQGLHKFGYPISPVNTTATTLLSQRFEHATIQCDLQSKQCKTI
ncbi:D-alanyl-D-alanine carboxypeptidase family protein [Dictyobacter formicarum]|uniref:Peptidase S11 D-alanyl-D-alanine carboxypeptidase A N-terminal domain-containing protein n=1 Tax=Dictyobacter formicarum TaxID=2778368 RepID=A0ABQ3VD79_9CHLR|nr:D-alanyl-D-alanine carboxypeptidase family protein [Dictyobacter formicarum]GHO83426.1 hypothetical protein KSZ_14320 [Dictyobacter formicarum]